MTTVPSLTDGLSTPAPRLILGSGSAYRRELLQRLGLPFAIDSPDVDEQPETGETPRALAMRLALAKARAVGDRHADDVVVIGSDQVADLDGRPLGKPGGHEAAVAQWRSMRGRIVRFHTALAVWRPRQGAMLSHHSEVVVHMRDVSDAEIERYLRREQPYDCAGSAKVESLGVAMLDAVHGDDPTALIGLPLIALCRLLRQIGLDPLA